MKTNLDSIQIKFDLDLSRFVHVKGVIVAFGAVILLVASKQNSAFEEGIFRPIPPILAGSARREHLASELDGCPVVAEINFSHMTC